MNRDGYAKGYFDETQQSMIKRKETFLFIQVPTLYRALF